METEIVKKSPQRPAATVADLGKGPAEPTIEEMFGLLVHVKLAVDAIRGQLAAKHKPSYTVAEVAELTGRSSYTVRRWIAEGRIKAIRIQGTGPKGRLLVPRDQLESLVSAGMGDAIPSVVVG
jgi:excisionase family DNA binding protein